jgi:hypothetical protein
VSTVLSCPKGLSVATAIALTANQILKIPIFVVPFAIPFSLGEVRYQRSLEVIDC